MTQFDVTECGAAGDGKTDDTDAIQEAIDACGDEGGGTVDVPAGEYSVEPLFLRDDVTVRVGAGATLYASTAIDEYPIIEGRTGGVERDQYASLLTGRGLENVTITGRGTLDGQGRPWWEALEVVDDREDSRWHAGLDHARPRTINLYDCENVLVRDVSIRNSPSWTIHPVYCDDVTIDNVSINNPPDSPNTDGVNPDSCRNVRIANCHIDVGDDCVTIKSGKDEDGRRVGAPCENVTVTNCTMIRGHGGVVIGSEMSGDVRNVTVSNCTFVDTDRGVRIKTRRGRGGVVEDVRFSTVVMERVVSPFVINCFYQTAIDADPEPVTDETPAMRNLHFEDITAREVCSAGRIVGLPERPLEGITFSNVDVAATRPFEAAEGADAPTDTYSGVEPAMADGYEASPALSVRMAEDVEIDGHRVRTLSGPALAFEDVTHLHVNGLRPREPPSDSSVVSLVDVRDAAVAGCTHGSDATFLSVGGESRNVVVDATVLPDDAVDVESDVPADAVTVVSRLRRE